MGCSSFLVLENKNYFKKLTKGVVKMSYMSLHQFIQEKKRKEREVLEEKFRQEEAQLREEYQAYVKAEEEKQQAEREAMFGKFPNANELRVINGVPIVFITDDFSVVKEVKVVRSLDDLTRQQYGELYTLERGVWGRLSDGMTNFEVDEKLLSKAYTMRLEEFCDMAYCFELGRKKGYSDTTIEQMLETDTPAEVGRKLIAFSK